MKKKCFIACLVGVLAAIGVCGCGNSTVGNSANSSAESTASATVIEPMEATVDINNLKDCDILVDFNVSNINWMNGTVDVDVYEITNYDMIDINNLKEGDVIKTSMEDIVVKTIKDVDSGKVINENEEGDASFVVPENSSGIYQLVRVDDQRDMQYLGKAQLTLSDKVTLTDCTDNPGEVIEVSHDQIKNHMEGLDELHDRFCPHNTTMTIENGEVTHITRVWTP